MLLPLLFLLVAPSTAQNEDTTPAVTLDGGSTTQEGYLNLQLNSGVQVGVCGGNQGLADAACLWAGFSRGEFLPDKWSDAATPNISWYFRFECETGAENLTGCVTKRCEVPGRVFLKCVSYPSCSLPTGQVIPGNTARWVGDDRVCKCGEHGKVKCDCRYVKRVTCPDGRAAQLDEFCDPICGVVTECKDVQILTLCKFYRDQGLCQANKTVRDMCRNTCEICQDETPTSEDTCRDQYGTDICVSWREQGACSRDLVRERCQLSCGECDGTSTTSTEESTTSSCSDQYNRESCSMWREAGHCVSNKSVRSWCQATCGLCPAASSCGNTLSASTCRVAVESDSCRGNLIVLRGCKRACGACGGEKGCRDIYRSTICRIWKDKGRCESSEEVRVICAETCGECTVTKTTETAESECVDTSVSSLCEYYKSVGYCESETHKEAISTQCKRTCGYCSEEDQEKLPP
eukprot:sb/3464474/